MKISFSSKARTLKCLENELKSAKIPNFTIIKRNQWNESKKNINILVDNSLREPVIIRSSSITEDTSTESNAGKYLSIPNVNKEDIYIAIEKVFASYDQISKEDEVIIQEMVPSVICSGVAFTHDPKTKSPYTIINWSDGSDTSLVTSGRGGRSWIQVEGATNTPENLKPVITLIEELYILFGYKPLDIEFAISKYEENIDIWLLQVRQLILEPIESQHSLVTRLSLIQKKVSRGIRPHPHILGKRTLYGVMPDWNPAEIIGLRPKPLALSLYRELVTDSIWAYQRDNYGYRNLRSFPLMPSFMGLPYIDVRLSFNSFIPSDLEEGIANTLVNYYTDKLLLEPKLHDKIEFEIVFSCYTLDINDRLEVLKKYGLSVNQISCISNSLRKLTNNIIQDKPSVWHNDISKIDKLIERRSVLENSFSDPIQKIYWLLEDTKRYGTLPFAGLARAAFIASQILNSLNHIGILNKDEISTFLQSLSTITRQMVYDRYNTDKNSFLEKYGHLRPGTYDILSNRYDETPELYFDWDNKSSNNKSHLSIKEFKLSLDQTKELDTHIKNHKLETNASKLMMFIKQAIEYREYSKYQFTKNLSDALRQICEYGIQMGFKREDLAFVDISVFKELHVAATDPYKLIRNSIEQGKELYNETLRTILPPLITSPQDILGFEIPETQPNFITNANVTAEVCKDPNNTFDLKEKIVCIENADPGYDWIFDSDITGFITAWGGQSSHMAIRASELSIPAVIGCGESLYQYWSNSKIIQMNCANQQVIIIS